MNNVTDYRANGYERAEEPAKEFAERRGFLNMSPLTKFQMHVKKKKILKSMF